MKITKIGIFTEEQLCGDFALDTIKNIGLECTYSDLARITSNTFDETTGTGEYWFDGLPSQNKPKQRSRKSINRAGCINGMNIDDKKRGVRIVVNLSDIEDFKDSQVDDMVLEFPQTAINGMVGKTIDKMFQTRSKLLFKTGKQYDINNELFEEFEVLGIRFIKIQNKAGKIMLSDGTFANKDQIIYVKVEEVPFVFDKNIIYSYPCVLSSPFDNSNIQFSDSQLNRYLNNGFLKSINDELEHKKPSSAFEKEEIESNRYGFDFSSLSEEEIVEVCIKSNIAVFLHGKTGTGKTERMISLDKDLELIDFGCTSSDGFTGIIAKDFNSKELFLYEPYWYKNLCKKCEEHPELIHILFFEELPNAKSDVQKVAFEVALNKTLTNSGFRLHLPKNAVVCGAGNEASESRSSCGLSEPLFGRFAHVYFDTDSNDWLKWALKRKQEGRVLEYVEQEDNKKIHPSIIDYITINGDKVLRTPYDGIKPNSDPRKWTMASKALYQCNNPNVLRAFIGEEMTQDFIKFCKLQLVTIDDIINDRCTKEQIPTDPSIKWFTALCLSTVDDEHFEKIRSFVENFGKEFLAVFDYEWSKSYDQRILKLYKEKHPSYVKKLVPDAIE